MNDLRKFFEAGDGATVQIGSEAYACTVINVTRTKINIQEDLATLLNGFNSDEDDALQYVEGGYCMHVEGVQRYQYTTDIDGRIFTGTLRKNGTIVRVGSSMRSSGNKICYGRDKHHDYNF